MVEACLAAEGFVCRDVYSLLNDPDALERAMPLLFDLMSEVRSNFVKIDLVRVACGGKVPPRRLVEELRRLLPSLGPADSSSGTRNLAWALADGLRDSADDSVYEDLVELIQEPRLGSARGMLAHAMARVKGQRERTIRFYGFDSFGNLTAITSYVNGVGSTRTHSVAATTNRLSLGGYDAAGNQTTWGSYVYTWDPTGAMKSYQGGGNDYRSTW